MIIDQITNIAKHWKWIDERYDLIIYNFHQTLFSEWVYIDKNSSIDDIYITCIVNISSTKTFLFKYFHFLMKLGKLV